MQQLDPVYDASQLSKLKIYQYKGVLYRYLCKCPYARNTYPQWIFEPLAGQRSKVNIKLNSNKIRSGSIAECTGMLATAKSQVTQSGIQQTLF
ncbi:hypothetical protein NIES4101_33950 [Calothrix sp. NIES-4101]|nr:hypothetical protein NIES4101_33950 [Calothrix sp. NIES-4101]